MERSRLPQPALHVKTGHAAEVVFIVRDDAEADASPVGLARVGKVFDNTRRFAEAYGQDAGCGRVERAGMANALDAGPAPDESNDIE